MQIRKLTQGFGRALMLIVLLGAMAISADGIQKITTDKLGGELRYLVYSSTDKPLYRAGETVYLRNVVLNASDNTPALESRLDVHVKIQGPKGEVVFENTAAGDDSTVGLSWLVPAGTPGGEYTALITSPVLGFPMISRSFDVRAYRAPRIKSQIEYQRDSYGPGETVQASINVERVEGGFPENAQIIAIARVDGVEVYRQSGISLGSSGTASIEFDLPAKIEFGHGTLAFIVEDGGLVETASKSLSIVLQNLDIEFYPEGGDLVAGLENRVYFQATTPDGEPADIAGRIIDLANPGSEHGQLAQVVSQHEGRGTFKITPETGARYALVLDTPSGITRQFALPESKTSGTSISSTKAVYEYDEKITIAVSSTETGGASYLTLHKREVLLDEIRLDEIKPNTQQDSSTTTSLNAGDSEGVLIVTAWDDSNSPLAERLVFRKPRFSLNVEFHVKEETLVPGGSVSVDIVTTDKDGSPVEAVVGITVTDDAVLELIEKREQAPRLPVMVYLEHEVKDLADAAVYLDSANKQAPQSLDLLLGTQGWRRFILVDYDQIKQQQPLEAIRAMAERIPEMVALPMVAFKAMAINEEVDVDFAAQAAPIAPVAAPEEILEAEAFRGDEEDIALGDIAEEPMAQAKRIARPAQVVREYSFQVRPNRQPNERIDFTETLYWHKGIRTSARDGKASFNFDLSDSVTTFRMMADGFGRNGSIGSGDKLISSIEPFYIEPLLPLEATVGDTIEVPVTMVNASGMNMDAIQLQVKAESLQLTQPEVVSLLPGERQRLIVKMIPTKPGRFPVTLSSAAGPYSDTITRTLIVKPAGFPVSVHHGGLLGPQSSFTTEITLPDEVAPGSLAAVAKVYPSPLASMEEALNSLLRQPNGCFEQTSSTTYPLVMAQQYFMTHQGVSVDKIASARDLLTAGYQKLVGFESSDKGYEWFGASPAHEALTAYGLMEFVDMSKVMSVDTAMISRTRQWLMQRRDSQGGFKRNEKALDSFGGAPVATTNSYIVWALLESGEDPLNLKLEIATAKKHALNSDDHYSVALTANILYLANDLQGATTLAKKLVNAVNQQGAVEGALTSITRSGGDALQIETTSLAILAWLKDDAQWAAQVEESMKWLFERSKSGQFGSTQSTVLALKAINAYDAARAAPKQAGSVQLLIDNKPFGVPVHFDPSSKGAILLPDFSSAMSAGRTNRANHKVALRMTDGSKMPFSLEINYYTTLPPSSEQSAIDLDTRLSTSIVDEGEILELEVTVTVRDDDAPTPIAIVGIPAGLEVRHEQLKELVRAEHISSYEVVGREVYLYWRMLKAFEQRVIPISLTAKLPGRYTGPASRAYLYYTDEFKRWSKGHEVSIRSRQG